MKNNITLSLISITFSIISLFLCAYWVGTVFAVISIWAGTLVASRLYKTPEQEIYFFALLGITISLLNIIMFLHSLAFTY